MNQREEYRAMVTAELTTMTGGEYTEEAITVMATALTDLCHPNGPKILMVSKHNSNMVQCMHIPDNIDYLIAKELRPEPTRDHILMENQLQLDGTFIMMGMCPTCGKIYRKEQI